MDNDIRDLLGKMRVLKENTNNGHLLLEEEYKSGDAIAITDDPKFGQNVLTNQIEQFRSVVDSGTQFAEPNDNDVSSSPLIYIPKRGNKPANLIFSGIIPSLKNTKFQFILQTDSIYGCLLWCDGLVLTKDNMETLQKLYGFYENWRKEWNMETKDLEHMASAMED